MTVFHDSDWWSTELKRMLRDQEPENLHLDYKDKRGLLHNKQKRADDVSKDVSSFLNSDGGAIIYGVPEAKGSSATGGAPIPMNTSPSSDLGFEQSEIDKEIIENVITSTIQPRPGPDQFQINEVRFGDRTVFIVEVAVGTGEVWQARDKRYYKRFHFKAEPMEHYEIGMVRNRQIGPLLKLAFGLDERWQTQMHHLHTPSHLSIHVGVQNASNSVAQSALIELGVHYREMDMPSPFQVAGIRKLKFEGSPPDGLQMKWHQVSWTASNPDLGGKFGPIFKTVSPMHVARFQCDAQHYVRPWIWRIQAPDMAPMTGSARARYDDFGGARIYEEGCEPDIV